MKGHGPFKGEIITKIGLIYMKKKKPLENLLRITGPEKLKFT
jgi:hypothetical protein